MARSVKKGPFVDAHLVRKIDVAQDSKRISSVRQLAKRKKLEFFEISAVTGKGIAELKRAMAERVLTPMPTPAAPD